MPRVWVKRRIPARICGFYSPANALFKFQTYLAIHSRRMATCLTDWRANAITDLMTGGGGSSGALPVLLAAAIFLGAAPLACAAGPRRPLEMHDLSRWSFDGGEWRSGQDGVMRPPEKFSGVLHRVLSARVVPRSGRSLRIPSGASSAMPAWRFMHGMRAITIWFTFRLGASSGA